MSANDRRSKNVEVIRHIYELFTTATQVCFVTLENVGSRQVQQIRIALAKKGATLLIGKNSVIKFALNLRANDLNMKYEDAEHLSQWGTKGIQSLKVLEQQLVGKLALVVSDRPVFELMPIIYSNRIATVAKVGVTSPVDVTVTAGPTGMDPSQISFFHALKITTKINKGQIEILKDVEVLKVGQVVGNSEASFLAKMNLKPFQYGMELHSVYVDGTILDKEIAQIKPEDLLNSFSRGLKNIAAISLETGYVTAPAVPHMLMTAFKNVLAVSCESGYKLAALEAAKASAGSAPAQQSGGAKVEAKVEEPEEEEEMDFGGGGMFGDDDF